jgi:putative membrane protein
MGWSYRDDTNQKLAAHLRELSGEELDREYMKEMIAEHSKMAAKFEAETRQEQDTEVLQWAERQVPIFQGHLQMAQSIHEKLTAPH